MFEFIGNLFGWVIGNALLILCSYLVGYLTGPIIMPKIGKMLDKLFWNK
jgi:hypothetical protein